MRSCPSRLLLLVVCAACVLVPTAAIASGGSGQVWVTGSCRDEHFKPHVIVLACGDGNTYLKNLRWSSWSFSTAKASGTYAVNTCMPSCAGGHFVTYPVKVTLSQPGGCRGQAHKAFKRVVLTTTRRNARGFVKRWSLGCPTR